MRELSIYIHIPFCVRKCLYCDFLSFPMAEGENGRWALPGTSRAVEMESYVNLLEREIEGEAEKYGSHKVVSVFWGGGTPSLLEAEEVTRIMAVLGRCYRLAEDAEITIEVNPGTVTAGKLAAYQTAGINRLSIGLQSADDGELARIGRIHDYRAFLETYRAAREAGFRNINVDLMAALPGQSLESYRETLQKTAALGPEHISAYSLILEEGTPLYERQQDYCFPNEEEDREMYLLTDTYLSACGYHRYEISNYAREGYECRHNKVYWQRGDYAGFGLGASSMVQNVRWRNPEEFERYEALVLGGRGEGRPSCACTDADGGPGGYRAGLVQRQALTEQEQMEEFMFLGLRLIHGVSCEAFEEQFGRRIEEVYGPALDKLCGQGLLVRGDGRIRLTTRGLDVSNYVCAEFLL